MKGDNELPILKQRVNLSGLDEVQRKVDLLREQGVTGYALSVASMELSKARLEKDNPGWKGVCYLYFAYFGANSRASFLKVGISNNPGFRMGGLATGNPFDRLWVYAVKFPDRKSAGRSERSLHRALADSHRRGEWFYVNELDEPQCRHHALKLRAEVVGGDDSLFQVVD